LSNETISDPAADQELRWPRAARWIGPAVFFVALIVRMLGIGWGLPGATTAFGLHPDEPIVLGYSQQIDVATGKIDPGFYNYGTLYLTTLSIATKVVDGYSPLPEKPSEADFIGQQRKHMLAGRFLNVLAGAGMAWVVVGIMLCFRWRVGAVAAGLAIALSPGLSVHSAFATVDVFAAFLLSLGLLGAVKLWVGRDDVAPDRYLRWAALSGLAVGLSAGTKYTGILGLVVVVGVIALAKHVRWQFSAVLASIMGLAGFVLGTPGVVLHTAKFWEDFRYEMVHTSTGHGLVFEATPSGFVMHVGHLMESMGGLLLIFGLVGLIWALVRRERWWIPFVIFATLYFVLIGRAEVKFLRYVFPLIPVLAVGFGYAVQRLHESGRRWGVALGIVALAGFGGGGAASCLTYGAWMRGPDPRESAADYLRKVGTGKSVGLVSDSWFYTPTLFLFASAPRAVPFDQRLARQAATNNPNVIQYLPADPGQRMTWDIRLLDEMRPDFVVYSSFEIDDVERIYASKLDAGNPDTEWNRASRFITRLQADYQLATMFGIDGPKTHDLMYVRPRVWIWQRKKT
jgi:hypothetical protein